MDKKSVTIKTRLSAPESQFDMKYGILNKKTPANTFLSARYKQSFAYHTMRNRLPVILTGIIDSMTKDKDELVATYGEESREEIKTVIGLLSKLKYQLQTDKEMQLFKGNEPDKELWNGFLAKLSPTCNSFFKACWLYAECYLYRKIYSFIEATNTLKNFDYFAKQKKNGLIISVEFMEAILQGLRTKEKSDDILKLILKINLWGNRCDLSISVGKEVKISGNPFEHISALDGNILINNLNAVCRHLNKADASKGLIVDLICDNAGYELFTDFLLADYLIEKHGITKVRFHVKALPWFVSDVTAADFMWTLDYLKRQTLMALNDSGKKWWQYFQEGKFELAPTEYFWTSPYEFYRMREVNPELHKKLSESYIIILKGDLNYRKLISDFSWDNTENFITCLRGFQPSNIVSLRTVKADLICSLPYGRAEQLNQKDKDWMTTGDYGTIQFAEKSDCGC